GAGRVGAAGRPAPDVRVALLVAVRTPGGLRGNQGVGARRARGGRRGRVGRLAPGLEVELGGAALEPLRHDRYQGKCRRGLPRPLARITGLHPGQKDLLGQERLEYVQLVRAEVGTVVVEIAEPGAEEVHPEVVLAHIREDRGLVECAGPAVRWFGRAALATAGDRTCVGWRVGDRVAALALDTQRC